MNHAIISRYKLNDLTKPDRVYSVRDKVQGVLFAEGKIVLSTSYGLADSVYYIYNEADFTNGRWVTANPIDPDKDI